MKSDATLCERERGCRFITLSLIKRRGKKEIRHTLINIFLSDLHDTLQRDSREKMNKDNAFGDQRAEDSLCADVERLARESTLCRRCYIQRQSKDECFRRWLRMLPVRKTTLASKTEINNSWQICDDCFCCLTQWLIRSSQEDITVADVNDASWREEDL